MSKKKNRTPAEKAALKAERRANHERHVAKKARRTKNRAEQLRLRVIGQERRAREKAEKQRAQEVMLRQVEGERLQSKRLRHRERCVKLAVLEAGALGISHPDSGIPDTYELSAMGEVALWKLRVELAGVDWVSFLPEEIQEKVRRHWAEKERE